MTKATQREEYVTVLPLQLDPHSERAVQSAVRFVADADQRNDHSGLPIEPATDDALPYRYKVRLPGGNAYALTVDEVLGLFIDDDTYDLTPERTYAAMTDSEASSLAIRQVTARTRHCLALLVDHAAQAIIAGEDDDRVQVMQQACDVDNPPTVEDCAKWTAEVPLLLIAELYPVEGDADMPARVPPAGNVEFLHPGDAGRYLADLARLGYIALQENPAYATPPHTTLTMDPTTEQEPADVAPNVQERADEEPAGGVDHGDA